MIQIAPGVVLPDDVVTQSLALLAVRRAGKSNAAAVLAEEMWDAGLPLVVIDPKGDWWGLRSNQHGDGPGLPVVLLGGIHGDLPLTPESGRLIADLVTGQNLTCVLDVSDFPSKAAQTRFLTDFADQLFRNHRRNRHPRHVILEEADDYIPQRVMADMAACVGAWTKIVKQGGAFGLGITIISQRSAVVNKDALTQVETLIALRTTSPQDRAAIRAWVEVHDAGKEIVESLPGLDDGEAWVCSPHWRARHEQPPIERFRFRRRRTYDSGATPTMADTLSRPATLADINLTAIQAEMTAVTARAADDDPAILRRRVTQLEKQLASTGAPAAGVSAELEQLHAENTGLRTRLEHATRELDLLREQVTRITTAGQQVAAAAAALASAVTGAGGTPAPPPATTPAVRRVPAPARTPNVRIPAEDVQLSKAMRAILTVLAQYGPMGRTRTQLALLTGYSSNGGGFRNALSALRTAGLITGGTPATQSAITPAGLAAIDGQWEPLPTGTALVDHWCKETGKAGGLILKALLAAHPRPMTRQQLAEVTGYQPDGGGFRNTLSRLRTLELIDGRDPIRVHDTLAYHAANPQAR